MAVPAGRGSGKTEIAKRKLVTQLFITKPWKTRYFYGGPTFGQARRVAWQDFIDMIPKEVVRNVYNSDMRITTVYGSELVVVGMDSPHRMEGVQWDGCVLDESCDLKPGVFDLSIYPALTHRRGWCWRIGVPKRQGIGAREYREFYERAAAGELDDAAAFTWPSSDILPADVLRNARENMDARDYREQFEASWETAGGQVFYAFDRHKNCRPCPYNPEKVLVVGSDFNVDPMAWVIGHSYDNRMEWIDELWIRNTNTQAALDVLATRYGSHKGGFAFYGDASGRGRRTAAADTDYKLILNHPRLCELGRSIHYPRQNPPVKDRNASVNAMFCNADGNRRMFIDPRCKQLVADIESRSYKPGTVEANDYGDVGHITDAMAYAVHKLFPIRVAMPGVHTVITT